MENKNFDQFIKQALENLDGKNHVPMDWSIMNDRLDTELEVDSFDEMIQQNLGNLDGAAVVPMNWDALSDKLDVELGAEIEADPFDQMVQKSLENLDGEKYVAMDWGAMDNKLDTEAHIEDVYLDTVAYGHLKNMETPYNQEHWKIMASRLDEEYAYRRKVMITKSLEAAVVLLLIWTAVNFFPFQPANQNVANSNQDNTNNLKEVVVTPGNLYASDESTSTVSNSTNTVTPQNAESEVIVEEIASLPTTYAFGNNNALAINEDLINIIPPVVSHRIKTSPSPSLSEAASVSLIAKEKKYNSALIAEDLGSEGNILEEKLKIQISPLQSLLPSLLSSEEYEENDYSSIPDIFRKKKLRTHDVFFSMFSNLNFDYVESDFYNKDIRQQDVFQRDRYSYGGGFALGFQLKRFLVETGLSYNYVSYTQRAEANIIGSFAKGFVEEQWEDAELNMVQVPLNIQYSFLLKKKWRMYSLTGLSLNVAVTNNFNFQVEETTATRAPIESKIANEAATYQGLFEGGSLYQNSYLTANIGLGIERKLTYRWSVFLQPVYRHYILFDGLGPNQDRIYSGNVSFGAKVKIR